MVIDFLRVEAPDLVALQEAAQTTEIANRAQVIAEAAGYEYVWTSADMGEPEDYKGGPAVLSRWPIASQTIEDLRFDGRPGEYQSRAIRIVASSPFGPIAFVGVHVTTIDADNLQRDQILGGASLLLQEEHDQPSFYAGDFNVVPDSEGILALKGLDDGVFSDAWTLARPDDSGFTYPSSGPDRRIDYIFAKSGTVQRAEPSSCTLYTNASQGTRVSDHLGVLCDFELRDAD